MIILGIETSCDETSAAVIRINKDRDSFEVLSNTISTSLSLHAKTGGIIPEAAAREQSKFIWPVLKEALSPLSNSVQDSLNFVDAVACTYGPGLIGSLLVGVETARTISMIQQIPLIPVNHMYGHIYANWLTPHQEIVFPALALVVSGGPYRFTLT